MAVLSINWSLMKTIWLLSSDAVHFLNPPTTMGGGIDMRTPNTSATTFNSSLTSNQGYADGAADVTLVRIPKGQSITVRYKYIEIRTTFYLSVNKWLVANLSSTTIWAKANHGCIVRQQIDGRRIVQDVYARINHYGCLWWWYGWVGVANRNGFPFMIGVSNGTSAG